MKEKVPFSLKHRMRAFKYALNGLKILIGEEHNARIHLSVTVVVILTAIALRVSSGEWQALILVIALVFALEAINSALENLCNFVQPDLHESIKRIKDLSAGAVFIAATAAVAVGLIIFVPKVIEHL